MKTKAPWQCMVGPGDVAQVSIVNGLRVKPHVKRTLASLGFPPYCQMAGGGHEHSGITIEAEAPSHGENRGSSPLGSANNINGLHLRNLPVSRPCPVGILGSRA